MAGGAPSTRRRLARLAAALWGLTWLTFCFGVIDLAYVVDALAPASAPTNATSEVGVLEVAYGAVATVLVATAFLAQARAGQDHRGAVRQVSAVTAAFAVAGAASLDALSFVSVAMLLLMQGSLLALRRDRLPAWPLRGTAPSRAVLAVVALGAVPWAAYAWSMAVHGRERLVPEHEALRPQAGGWAGAVVLAVAVLLLGLLAATGGPGWRLSLWTTGVAVLLFAVTALRFPSYPGSPGTAWSALALVWAIVLVATGEAAHASGARGPVDLSPTRPHAARAAAAAPRRGRPGRVRPHRGASRRGGRSSGPSRP
jgi:hypothetical protein